MNIGNHDCPSQKWCRAVPPLIVTLMVGFASPGHICVGLANVDTLDVVDDCVEVVDVFVEDIVSLLANSASTLNIKVLSVSL